MESIGIKWIKNITTLLQIPVSIIRELSPRSLPTILFNSLARISLELLSSHLDWLRLDRRLRGAQQTEQSRPFFRATPEIVKANRFPERSPRIEVASPDTDSLVSTLDPFDSSA